MSYYEVTFSISNNTPQAATTPVEHSHKSSFKNITQIIKKEY
jgi:hypothetical protein